MEEIQTMNSVIDLRWPGSADPDFLIYWERLCNSGLVLVNAKSQEDAMSKGWSLKVVRQFVIPIAKGSKPLIAGKMT